MHDSADRTASDSCPVSATLRRVSAIEIRRDPLHSAVARTLIVALNAELLARYPEEGATHFRLDDGVAEVKRMYVVPAARGLGVGAVILAALEAEARALGATRLVLETGERQPEAIALYRRAGFSVIPRFGEYVDSALSLCMGKDLGPR